MKQSFIIKNLLHFKGFDQNIEIACCVTSLLYSTGTLCLNNGNIVSTHAETRNHAFKKIYIQIYKNATTRITSHEFSSKRPNITDTVQQSISRL